MGRNSVSFEEGGFTVTDHPDIPLTARTVPALAQAFIADGNIESFGTLLYNASRAKNSTALLSTVKPSLVKAAIAAAIQPNDTDFPVWVNYDALIQMADAVRTIPKLSATFTPKISTIVIDKIDAERKAGKRSGWFQSFAMFAHAIADKPERRALLKAEMVAEAAHILTQASHSVSNFYREPLHLYHKDYAVGFAKLATAVKNDNRLNTAIEAEGVGQIAKAILHIDFNSVQNRDLTDEGYPTYSVPKNAAMQWFASFAETMADAREDWKAAIAEQIDPFIREDRDRLAGYYLRDIIAAHSYLKNASQPAPA